MKAWEAAAKLFDSIRFHRTLREAARVLEATPANETSGVVEGARCRVVLITEGLGNRSNMNYYGPEAIRSAPGIFEGKPCFLDHPTDAESRDIPERRTMQKCGYFKNCRVESLDGVVACTAELHFDLSESGTQAYLKACTALHYKEEFPGLESEYVGLSIHADGDIEDRTVEWQGERLDVKYVTRFTDALSCDIVTSPARGGRFLALVESAAGAYWKKHTKEEAMDKLQESLKAAHTALGDADKEKDPTKKAALIAEAKSKFDAYLKEAKKAAEGSEEESETEDESEEESEGKMKQGKKQAKKQSRKQSEDESEEESDDAPKKKKKDDADDEDDDAVESRRIAVDAMLKEAGLEKFMGAGKLARLSLAEAKEEIATQKKFKDALLAEAARALDVPVASFQKLSESERKEVSSRNMDLFDNCYRD